MSKVKIVISVLPPETLSSLNSSFSERSSEGSSPYDEKHPKLKLIGRQRHYRDLTQVIATQFLRKRSISSNT